MNGFCGLLSKDNISLDEYAFTKSINLVDTMQTQTISEENFFAGVSYLESSPLAGTRIYNNDTLLILFAGDLVDYNEIPWDDIVTNFSLSNFEWYSTFRGVFALVVYDKKQKKINLISDNRAQHPIYFGYHDNSFIFSTSIASFTTLKSIPNFNTRWLFEYFYFNFPIDNTTCLVGIERLRSSSIVTFDLESNIISRVDYGEKLKRADTILTGKKAFDLGYKTFKERVSKYYCFDRKNFVAISGGFDSRTLLSLAPKNANVEGYTYGTPGSNDLHAVSKLKNKIKLKHKEIFFNTDFEASLPDLIHDTVRLSGGVQSILRSTLPFVYKTLSIHNKSQETPIVIGGIGGDLFRGAPGTPDSSLSAGMCNFYRTGKVQVEKNGFNKLFKNNWNDFEKHIRETLIKIKKLYGDPLKPETAMSFDNYEINPKYFGGEFAIASNYLTMRLPFLDIDILKFAYKSEFSNLGLSPFIHNKKYLSFKKYIFQSKLICSNPAFRKTYINGMPITLYASGNKLLFQLSRLFIRGFARLKGEHIAHNRLEDWENWSKNVLINEFDELLNDDSLILDYFDKEIISSAKECNDIHLLNKLVTTEILLGLIKNRWDIKTEIK